MGIQPSKNIILDGIKTNLNPNLFEEANNSEESINKYYFIPLRENLHIIQVKIINNKIFLYLFNRTNENKSLVHIFDTDGNISMIEKYIQISHDMKTISIPDENYLHIYKVDELITNQILEFSELNTKLKLDSNIPTLEKIKNTKNIHSASITTDELQKNKNELFPYKCLLYSNKYIIVCKDILTNKYKNVLIYDFIQRKTQVINLNSSLDYKLLISENAKSMGIYDISEQKYLNLLPFSNGKSGDFDMLFKKVAILKSSENETPIYLNTLAISDDCNLITCITCDNKIRLIDIKNSNSTIEDYHIKTSLEINPKNSVINIFSYGDLCVNMFNKIYSVVIYDKREHTSLVFVLAKIDDQFILSNPKNIKFNVSDEIECTYTNSHNYIFKLKDNVVSCNINQEIIEAIIDTYLDVTKYKIQNLLSNFNKKNKKEYAIRISDGEENEIILTQHWIMSLFSVNENDTLELKFCENFDTRIFKCCDGNKISPANVIINLFQDHKLVNEYLYFISNESTKKRKMDIIFGFMLKFIEIFKIRNKNNEIILDLGTNYCEYLLVKIILLSYKNKSISINKIIYLFDKLRRSRPFYVKSLKLMFTVNLEEYVA